MNAFFDKLSRIMAYLGGAMLVFLILLTCASILGRSVNGLMHADYMSERFPDFANWVLSLGVGPINGDYELVEAGIAFAIFAFLPFCQMQRGHAAVDIFANRFPAFFTKILQVTIDALFAAVLVLIAVQLWAGMQSKLDSGQTSFLLEFPVWWGYALSLLGAIAAAAVAISLAVSRLWDVVTGRAGAVAQPEQDR